MTEQRSVERRTGVVLVGLLLALAVPVASVVVALAWDNGILNLEPNGAFVQGLQSTAALELFLGPIGIVVASLGLGLRNPIVITGILLAAIPILGILWFVAVAYLGGLAGEPF